MSDSPNIEQNLTFTSTGSAATVTDKILKLCTVAENLQLCLDNLKAGIQDLREKALEHFDDDVFTPPPTPPPPPPPSLPDYEGKLIRSGDVVYTLDKGKYKERYTRATTIDVRSGFVSIEFLKGKEKTRRKAKNLKRMNDWSP